MSSGTVGQFNPFPGLRPFQAEEDYLFFGREEQITDLLGLLRQHRFLAVVGTSGSGKSSLVRAGLLPALHGGTMTQAGSKWEVVVLRPGGDPVNNLTKALLDADLYDADDEESLPRLKATLTRSRLGLVEAVKQSDLPGGTNLLIVVDQFEELFRFRQTGLSGQEESAAFVRLMLGAIHQSEQRIYVAITMRSDYLGDCGHIPGLAEAVNSGEYLIPRLSREQRRAAIEKPVSVGGGRIAPRLVHKVLNDVGDDPDQLPVMQHALMRIWEAWVADHGDDEPLDLRHYERVGGLREALSLHADEVYDQLPDERHRVIAQKLFQALTERGPDNRGIRRPTRVDELCAIVAGEMGEVTRVIDAFRRSGRTFLMPMQDVELAPETVIDISHESLMRVWRRLSRWVEEESQSARIYRRLADTATLHAEGKAGVYYDPDLQIAVTWRDTARPTEAWAHRYDPGFDQAMEFLRVSGAAKLATEDAREAARRHELEQAKALAEAQRLRAEEQQHSAGRLRRLAGALAIAAVLALMAFGSALVAFRQANQQGEIARRARDEALAQRDATRVALGRAVTAEAAAENARGSAEAARDEAEIRAYTASLAASAADLKRNDSRTLQRRLEQVPERLRGWEWDYLWSESDRSLETPVALPATPLGYQMNLSEDGTMLAARPQGGHEKPVKIYDTRSGQEVATIKTFSSNVPNMTFSADKRLLAYAHWGTPGVQIYEIQTGKPLVPERSEHNYNSFLGFDPSGERAVVLGRDKILRVFQIKDWTQIAVVTENCALGSAANRRVGAISPDGKLLVVGAFVNEPMQVFDLQTNKSVAQIPGQYTADAVRFDHDGQVVTTLASDGTIYQYAVPEWKSVVTIRENRQRRNDLAVYGLDGRPSILSFESNGSVALFDRSTKSTTLRGHGAPGSAIAVDGEMERIVTAHTDGVVKRWDLRIPRDSPVRAQHVAIAPDRSMTLVGVASHASDPLQVGCLDTGSGEMLGYLRWYPATLMHGSTATDLAFSPDGRRVAVSTSSGWGWGRWRIYDLWTGLADFQELRGGGDWKCIDWSVNGKWIAVAGDQYGQSVGPIRVYDAEAHKQLAQMDDHQGTVNDLAFSHDSQLLITVAGDGTLRTWSMPDGKLLNKLGVEGGPSLECLALSPHGDHVVVGSADGSIVAWNPRDGAELHRSQAHGAAVTSVAFLPNGSRLATSAADRSLKIFDAKTWRELLTLHLEEPVQAMCFSPDGKQLVLATSSVTVLDTQREKQRSEERRLDREAKQRASPLIAGTLQNTNDFLQVREQLFAHPSVSEGAPKNIVMRELFSALDKNAQSAYQSDKLSALVVPHFSRHILRQQLVVAFGRPFRMDGFVDKMPALDNLDPMLRQAVMEYATAYAMAGAVDTNALAWKIAVNAQSEAQDFALAYFGMEALVRQNPHDEGVLNTWATAQYRVGLLRDAITSAEASESLLQQVKGSVPQNLAVIAMSHHRMGNTEQAAQAMRQLEQLMQKSRWAADKEAVALHNEAKLVLDKPPAETWDEQATWTSLKSQLQKLDLDSASYAMWLTNTCRLFASRNVTDPSQSWLNEAVELLRQLANSNPNSPLMHRRLSLALAVQGRSDEAANERQIAVDQEKIDPNYLVSLANLLRQAGQFGEAVSVLEQALRIDSKHFPSLMSLGSLQRQLGKLKESRETLRRGLEFDQSNPWVQSELRQTERALAVEPREVATER